jgi:Putative threonine efflux protein
LVHTTLASLGLSIILAKSVVAYNIVRYVGVAYLFYLGVRMIVEKNNLFESRDQKIASTSLIKIYWQGLLTNVLNPKVALFFLSFLPQFINPEYAKGAMPFIILGLTFLATGTLWCLFLASSASLVSKTLRDNDRIGKIMQKVSGIVFIGLGIKLLSDK